MSRLAGAAAFAATLAISPLARAGGFDELPDQGAQALGRGAAFTAKADDATALYYNVAGLARQRGTKALFSGNVQFNTIYFQRAGRYADDPTNPATPWGGKPYPLVENKESQFLLPMMIVTTDLGLSDRLTFAAGFFAPSAAAKTFPLGINKLPSPARYDAIAGGGIVAFPTLAAGYRLTPQIDIGIGAHLVVASLDELSVAYYDPGGGSCKNPEYFLCDAEAKLKADGMGFAGSAGILARPLPAFQLGAQVRTPASVAVSGTAGTKLGPTTLPDTATTVTIDFPWVVRAGARYIGVSPHPDDPKKPFEAYDLELDGVYEAWGAGGAIGPTAVTIDPATQKPTSVTIVHRWQDTFSVRLGGAYNIPVGDAVLTARAGAFYDSPTTESAYTRIDVNSLPKLAGTLGIGYRTGAVAANLAYAAVGSFSRIVTDGDIRPANAAKNGDFVDGDGKTLPAVNNGEYRAFSHVVSFSVEVNFSTLFGSEPKGQFGDPTTEDLARPPEAKPETKPEPPKKKDREKSVK